MKTILKQFKNIPFTHSNLVSLFLEYNNPNDKISQLLKNKEIIKIKKGLYILGNDYEESISRELIANHIYGPSYISMESALSYYGLIPEQLYDITSVTTKSTKEYITERGCFSFIKSPIALYKIGIVSEQVNNHSFLIASKTKAICDKIIFTKKINIRSQKELVIFLEDDLRIDLDELKDLNLREIDECIEVQRKSKQLILLKKILERG